MASSTWKPPTIPTSSCRWSASLKVKNILSHRLLDSCAANEASYLVALVHPIHNFSMSPADALLQESQALRRLYNAESMMALSESVAQGYLVLLGSGDDKVRPEKDVSLAFMALAHGNVIDACFGVHDPKRQQDTPASRTVRDAKQLMEECGQSDDFRVGAVQAYSEAFKAIVTYRTKYNGLNCITRCFRAQSLRVKCEVQLRESFLNLAKAVAEHH
jgi:hypothetical protein